MTTSTAAQRQPGLVERARDYRQPPAPLRRRGQVCVVDGYGIRIAVERGRLLVSDGSGRERREQSFSRVRPNLARIVILGSSGTVSLAAVRWLADLGVPLVQLDRDGQLLLCSAVNTADDARLRRAQAFALTNDAGLGIARSLLSEKLAGQEALLARLPASAEACAAFQTARQVFDRAGSSNELVIAERDAAFAYWTAWAPVEVRFRRSDLARVPEHWLRFGQRSSPLTSAPRSAVNPANAFLNYLYALLEAETRIACLMVGLDAGLGIVHVDVRGRDSLALDLMEAARPQVDRYLLDLLTRRGFRASDFYETRKGSCRILAPLTHTLAETAPDWGRLIAPIAERVAAMLAKAPGARIDRLPTPLTNANRHDGRERMRRRPPRGPETRPPKPTPACARCGGEVPSAERQLCDACLPAYQREQLEERFTGSGLKQLAELRTAGRDPTHGGEAASKRGRATAERKQQLADWERRHGKLIDLTAFEREILPQIQGTPLRKLMQATGLSLRYCSLIRRGERVPHPRHWEAFQAAARSDS